MTTDLSQLPHIRRLLIILHPSTCSQFKVQPIAITVAGVRTDYGVHKFARGLEAWNSAILCLQRINFAFSLTIDGRNSRSLNYGPSVAPKTKRRTEPTVLLRGLQYASFPHMAPW